MQTARLRNWSLCTACCWTGPGQHLHGDVFGHPSFQDGERITTTPIVDLREDIGIAVTKNTVYILRDVETDGDVLREYEVAA